MLKKILFPFKMLAILGMTTAFSTIMISCNDDGEDEDNAVMYNVTSSLDGLQEVPPSVTIASGTLSGTYNANNNAFAYTVSWSNLLAVPTVMHFHGPAAAGADADPVIDITGFTSAATGSYSGQATLSQAQEDQLYQGLLYINIHTSIYPGGEIRGQLTATRQ